MTRTVARVFGVVFSLVGLLGLKLCADLFARRSRDAPPVARVYGVSEPGARATVSRSRQSDAARDTDSGAGDLPMRVSSSRRRPSARHGFRTGLERVGA